MENLREQINESINVKSALENEIVNLKTYVNELKQHVAVQKSFYRYFKNELKTVKSEIVKAKETLEQLKRLCRDIYDMKAYDHLQNTLIDNIENVILKQDQFIPLIVMGVVEALRADPQKRKSLYDYDKKFKNDKLTLDNIDSRIAYFKGSEFWEDTSFYFQRLTEIYSQEVFAYVLEKYYKLYKINQKINNYQ